MRRVGYIHGRAVGDPLVLQSTVTYRVPIIYGSMNTTAEPDPFPARLGFDECQTSRLADDS